MKVRLLIFSSLFALVAIATQCSSGADTQETTETDTTELNLTSGEDSYSDTTSTGTGSDCDQFLKDYEDFATRYIAIVKKYKENPTDPSLLKEYADLSTQLQDIEKNAQNCTDPEYVAKIAAVADRIMRAASGLN